jgi:uncharacterized membrane protein
MNVRRAILAGVAGAVAIDLYLSISLQLMHVANGITLSQWDASNLLGNDAFRGGLSTAAIGFGLHLCVSVAWGIVFGLLYSRIAWVRAHALASGLIFGAVVMQVMAYAVVPLGHASHPAPALAGWLNNFVAHTLFFGVPVAWVVAGRKIS